jgi:hypothetical protein
MLLKIVDMWNEKLFYIFTSYLQFDTAAGNEYGITVVMYNCGLFQKYLWYGGLHINAFWVVNEAEFKSFTGYTKISEWFQPVCCNIW